MKASALPSLSDSALVNTKMASCSSLSRVSVAIHSLVPSQVTTSIIVSTSQTPKSSKISETIEDGERTGAARRWLRARATEAERSEDSLTVCGATRSCPWCGRSHHIRWLDTWAPGRASASNRRRRRRQRPRQPPMSNWSCRWCDRTATKSVWIDGWSESRIRHTVVK